MKKGKRIIVVLLLIIVALVITVIGTTYALYRSTTTATGSVDTAAWSVKIGSGQNAVAFDTATYTFSMSDVTWTQNVGQNNTIAPGAVGSITIPVDATGSEVGVVLTAALGSSASLPTGMTVSMASGSSEQTIAYNANSMTANVVVNIEWEGALSDLEAKDTSDKQAADSTISIPIELTARQVLPTAQP